MGRWDRKVLRFQALIQKELAELEATRERLERLEAILAFLGDGYSQAELAELAGVSRQRINQYVWRYIDGDVRRRSRC